MQEASVPSGVIGCGVTFGLARSCPIVVPVGLHRVVALPPQSRAVSHNSHIPRGSPDCQAAARRGQTELAGFPLRFGGILSRRARPPNPKRVRPATGCGTVATSPEAGGASRARPATRMTVCHTQIRAVAQSRLLLAKARRHDRADPFHLCDERRRRGIVRRRRSLPGRYPGVTGYAPRKGPAVSLVLATTELRQSFEAGLAGLVPECVRANIELVVACNAPRRSIEALRRRHPSVRFSAIDTPLPIADLRATGMRLASGDFVVLLDDASSAGGTARASALLAAAVSCAGAAAGGEARPAPRNALLARLWSPSTVGALPQDVDDDAAQHRPSMTSHVVGD